MDDLLGEFLAETAESIATVDAELINLEQNPNDQGILGNIFRLVHTIKGTCGFLGLPRLETLAHAGEDVLGKIREGGLEVTPAVVTLILKCIDQLKEILAYIEENEAEPEGDDKGLVDDLHALVDGSAVAAPTDTTAKNEEEVKAEDAGPVQSEGGFPVAAELLAEVEAATAQGIKAASYEEIAAEMEAEREVEVKSASKTVAKKEKAEKNNEKASEDKEKKEGKTSIANQSIRVHVDLLEDLMTLVSELVLTRNQLLQMIRGRDDSEFFTPLQRLSHITTDLQEGVMKTRMQPIGNAWNKLPRIVRDLALETGKKIDLKMLGAETELDRQVLELIKDPLTHMVRNSADHGLESTEERFAYGKSEVGTVTLNAYHEGGHIIIEISDDGKGLDIERIREKAIENGLIAESDIDNLTDHQIANYIFKPGFSTAEKITSVSGRGVGMDVVRTNIEKIGGNVELKTFPGEGTTFIIKIPLTLAIVSGLIVEAAGERFAIPQISVVELVRVTDKSEQKIEMINDAPVLRLRDRLLPLVNLTHLLQIDRRDEEGKIPNSSAEKKRNKNKSLVEGVDEESQAETEADVSESNAVSDDDRRKKAFEDGREIFIVVTQVGTNTFGIIVDKVFDTEEIVVKPVAPILRHITMFSGNTILGDGSVIMILDPNGIAVAAGEGASVSDHLASEETKVMDVTSADKVSMLIFKAGGNNLKAVPLALVARLEDIDVNNIEYSEGKPVVQYRGQLMPLVAIDGMPQIKEGGKQPVLVFADEEKSMGILVEEIVDIVEDYLNVELSNHIEGSVGTAVVAGNATDVIDTGYYLTRAFGDWFGSAENSVGGSNAQARVMIVDDSAFFRNLLTPIISAEGYDVVSFDNAKDALSLLKEERGAFDVVVSDIEMPEMDGFEFALAIRGDEKTKDIPLVALSSKSSESYIKRGNEVGFDEYAVKFDKEAIVGLLAKMMKKIRIIKAEKENENA
ncbi:MAG: hybrid sensor histidine kinase/response regulator [Alphaproteobacteria bacterium]|nr:hybrid sensor histidine kinase/response regulator [Alphaproteobacteria bacterium]